MTPEEITKRTEELITGLAAIPVEELVQCARENLKATYPVRVSKTESKEAPDYTVRQKALEWISAQRGASAVAPRKPAEPKAPTSGKTDAGGIRKKGE